MRTTRLQWIGLWNSPDNAGLDGPPYIDARLLAAASAYEPGEKSRIVEYLGGAPKVMLTGLLGYAECPFTGKSGPEQGSGERTDGVFAWPEGLARLLDHFDVMLPEGFLNHLRGNAFRTPTDAEIQALAPYEVSDAHWRQWCAEQRAKRSTAMRK